MMPISRWFVTTAAAAVLAIAAGTPADAALTLTAEGVAQGLALSTYADGFPSTSNVGPIAVGFPTGGNVLVSSYASGHVIAFSSDSDGQHYNSGSPSTQVYGTPAGIASYHGSAYLVDQGSGGTFVRLTSAGNVAATLATGMGTPTGLAIANGFAYISDNASYIRKYDLSNNTFTTLVNNVAVDGVTLSPDGSVLYAESNGHIYGFSTTTGASTGFDSGVISGADGAAAAVGNLAGDIFVNTNYGELWEVDSQGHQTLVASGGSRGDLVTIDPANGSLLLSQSDTVLRLTLPAGSSFSSDVPEPASFALLGCGLLAIARFRRRR